MIKQVSKIDSDGFFVEPVIVNDEDFDEDNPLPPYLIATPVPEGLYKPRWDGNKWVEGLTPEEIEELKRLHQPQPSELDLLKQENAEMKQRLESAESVIIALMDYL
jgi:hypothetical protein